MAETVANTRQSPKISLVADRIVGARLLEVVPDLDMSLTEDELKQASHLMLPVCTVRGTDSINELLTETGAFAASVIEGMLVHRMRLRTQTGMRLLAPGDIITREPSFHEGALEDSVFAAVGDVSIALFDDHLLIAARRCPRLVAALLLRLDQQSRRATSQMMICQLPRVEDRVLTMMWLLAETWGRVTPAGTFLAMRLTHQALGEMVGARRPTVTLALKQLSDRGALQRHQRGWLLIERPVLSGDHDGDIARLGLRRVAVTAPVAAPAGTGLTRRAAAAGSDSTEPAPANGSARGGTKGDLAGARDPGQARLRRA